MPGRSSMALFARIAGLNPGAHGARCAWAMVIHHAVGISLQRNSGYRPSRVNIVAQGLSTPDPSLSPIHLSIRRGRATTTHYTHHQVSLMVLCNTTLLPSLELCIGPACEAGLSAGMQREHVPLQIRKKERKKSWSVFHVQWILFTDMYPAVWCMVSLNIYCTYTEYFSTLYRHPGILHIWLVGSVVVRWQRQCVLWIQEP